MRSTAFLGLILGILLGGTKVSACAVVSWVKHLAVNADQTVILLWDKENQTQHFIRRASFATDGPGVGFLVPTPSEPELAESGEAAFAQLARLTAALRRVSNGGGCLIGCGVKESVAAEVVVLQQKRVAGFDASVLQTASGTALVDWLATNGYHHSPQLAEWAQPYLDQGWPMTALKVAKQEPLDDKKDVHTAALRISFKTDRVIFPYREPVSSEAALKLANKERMLRFYVIANEEMVGGFDEEAGTDSTDSTWTGVRQWSGEITTSRRRLLQALDLPEESTLMGRWWLTEFEDPWKYNEAPGDLYFTERGKSSPLKRADIASVSTGSQATFMGVFFFGAFGLRRMLRASDR